MIITDIAYFCQTMKKEKTIDQWIGGIPYEIAFWNNVYRWDISYQGMMNWSNYGSVISLECFDANAYLATIDHPLVLDVGCGMSYATGNYLNRGGLLQPLNLHYVDALAFYYNDILQRHHRNLPKINFGMLEYLSAFYPRQEVDLVIIQNALDHSSKPVKGLLQTLDTLKVGGKLYLNHHPHEAVVEQYKGFHQYNIDIEGGRLVIWNSEEKVVVDELVRPWAEIENITHENGHVVSIITKTHQLPHDSDQEKANIRELSETLSRMTKNNFSFRRFIRYKWDYARYNMIHFVVQALPWNVKMGIKKLIHQA